MKKQLILLLAISALPFVACDREIENPIEPGSVPTNSSEYYKPISVTSFYPETAKVGAEVAVFGDNFGHNISDNYVTIDGWASEITSVPRHGMVLFRIPQNLAPGEYSISVHAYGQTGTSPNALQIIDPKLKP